MKLDSTFAEKAFTKVLQTTHDAKYEPNVAEVGLIYRTMTHAFNPYGVWWALFGGLASFVFVRGKVGLPRRMLTLVGCSGYSYEISWLTLDPHPCNTFFTDIGSVNGKMSKMSPIQVTWQPDDRPLWLKAFDVITMDRTVNALLWPFYADKDQYSAWLLFFRKKWFAVLDRMDPLTKTYWRARIRLMKLQLRSRGSKGGKSRK